MSLRSVALVAVAAVLYTFALPPFEADVLAFVATAPLALLCLDPRRGLRVREAVVAALLFGETTTLAVGGHWLYHAARGFFGRSAVASVAFTLLVTVTHAGIFLAAAVAMSAAFARVRSGLLRVVAFACMWVAWEMVRSRLLYGCPWNLLGHALYRRPALMQAAGLGGVYLLSWLCAFCGTGLGVAWIERRRLGHAAALVVFALAVPAAAGVFGRAVLAGGGEVTKRESVPLRVGLVQANVGRAELWDATRGSRHLEQLLALSRTPELRGADLIVWAENAVPFLLDADSDARAKITALAHELGAFVLTGAPRATQDGAGHARLHNSVYLFSPDGREVRTYDKIKLLPYVERTPAWAASFLRPNPALEMWPGKELRVFDVRGRKIAPLICFESTYPELARAAVAHGAELLINVSNDSWFNRGAAPEQHFAMTSMRAAELGVPLLRVANTGVSAVVDARGRVLEELPRDVAAVSISEIPARKETTVYARFGDVFGWSCVASAFVLFAWACATPSGVSAAMRSEHTKRRDT